MYLFSRSARIAPGNTKAAMAWAGSVTEKVNQISGLPVGLYMQTFSPEVGRLAWSTFAPDLGALETANDKLMADDGYLSLIDSGAKFALGGADDLLSQIVYGAPDPNRPIEYVSTVTTTCTNGSVMRGVEVGVEIAQRVEKVTGLPSLFGTTVTGNYGSVGWITGYVDVAELERAQAAIAANADFGKFIDKNVSGVYTDDPTASQQLIFRKIG
jgi:hypothetical protein